MIQPHCAEIAIKPNSCNRLWFYSGVGVFYVIPAPPSVDNNDLSASLLTLSVSDRRRHTTCDSVSSDLSFTNDTSSYVGSLVSG